MWLVHLSGISFERRFYIIERRSVTNYERQTRDVSATKNLKLSLPLPCVLPGPAAGWLGKITSQHNDAILPTGLSISQTF